MMEGPAPLSLLLLCAAMPPVGAEGPEGIGGVGLTGIWLRGAARLFTKQSPNLNGGRGR